MDIFKSYTLTSRDPVQKGMPIHLALNIQFGHFVYDKRHNQMMVASFTCQLDFLYMQASGLKQALENKEEHSRAVEPKLAQAITRLAVAEDELNQVREMLLV